MSLDERWIRRALELAWRGRYTTSPNPMVGACVVRSGRLAGEGYHRAFGADHAEVEAIKKAGRRAQGATLYVTLEPCSTWGKTPPCVGDILKAGIRRVVVGALDPNPKNYGRGIKAMRREGVEVKSGVLAEEVKKQNESFFKRVKTGLPFVTLKMAQSLDGKIAAVTGKSRWISSKPARRFVHELRAGQDAIMVGRNTFLRDNPLLSPRILSGKLRPGRPWRIAIARAADLSKRARIFKGPQLTLIALAEKELGRLKKSKTGGIYLGIPEKKGQIDLRILLERLASLGVGKLLAEGGGELAWSLLSAKLVDRIYWIVAPKILGGRGAKSSVEGEGVPDPSRAFVPKSLTVSPLGEDWLFEGNF